MSDNYLKDLFIDEATPALQRHSGGGVSVQNGHTVVFKVNDEIYQVVSVQQGCSITEPTTPSAEGYFIGWKIDGFDTVFPYTPTGDIEIVADIRYEDIRTELEVMVDAGAAIGSFDGTNVIKSSKGTVIIGTYTTTSAAGWSDCYCMVAVDPKTIENATIVNGNATQEYVYNGKTFYYTTGSGYRKSFSTSHPTYNITSTSDRVKELLDYYYKVI